MHDPKGAIQYILVIVDHFTKYALAYPTRNKSSITASKRLYDNFVIRFGFPGSLLSDQGGEFQSKVLKQLHELAGVKGSRTTPYHPQCNGQCELMNKTLLQMLRTLPTTQKSSWPSMVNKMVQGYNCTQKSSTGFSPYFLLFGREPRLAIDCLLVLTRCANQEFADTWKKQIVICNFTRLHIYTNNVQGIVKIHSSASYVALHRMSVLTTTRQALRSCEMSASAGQKYF